MIRNLVLLALTCVSNSVQAQEGDAGRILAGVEALPASGTPGPVAVFGERAFALVLAAAEGGEAPLAAAARVGQGRVIVLGHSGYAQRVREPGMARFLRNAVEWLGNGKAQPRLGARAGWADSLEKAGLAPVALRLEQLEELDVLALPVLDLTEDEVARVAEFVERGGGLITAETGWGWQQLNPETPLAERPVQRWLARHGLAFTLDALASEGPYAVEALEAGRGNALTALARLEQGRKVQAEDGWTVAFAARALPAGPSDFGAELERLLARHAKALVASERKPLDEKEPLLRALAAAQWSLDKWSLDSARAPGAIEAHPAASDFPGLAGTPGITQELELDTALDGWLSTGLWADAGVAVTVELPPEALQAGLRLRIGAHADTLWHLDEWRRMPAITREFALTGAQTTVASAFGGALYLVVPEGCTLGLLRLTLRGAVPAPHFVLGRTTPEAWRAARRHPAPWAELEGKHLVLSVPARVVRELADPTALLEFWDRVLEAQAELAARPRTGLRPERFVLDRQISAGYMHSGYPIMTHLDVAEAVVDLEGLRTGRHMWGFVHELGHNLQRPAWTFEGTGEVTNNLFALYAIEKLCTLPAGQRGHEAVDSPPDLAAFRARGAPFDEWKSEPFLALRTFTLLQETFGWEPFRQFFAEHEALPHAQRPRTDDAKRDQWLTRLSRLVEHDLGPYFTACGLPTSAAARAEVAALPDGWPAGWSGQE